MEAGDILRGTNRLGSLRKWERTSLLSSPARVVIPFQISCGHCFHVSRKALQPMRNHAGDGPGNGAALFGFSKLYGEVPGGQAEYLRVPRQRRLTSRCRKVQPDDRFIFLSDVLPTAWQAVEYAAIPEAGTVVVLGLGPIGDMASRIAHHHGARVIAVDLVPNGCSAPEIGESRSLTSGTTRTTSVTLVRDQTAGRGPDSVIDAVGMEAHGSPAAEVSPER